MPASPSSILDDFLSGDHHRIYLATWAVIRSRDAEELEALRHAIPRIRKVVDPVPLGGMLRSNDDTFEHAMDKLEHLGRGLCWCESYPGLDQYDPNKEQDAGHTRILSTSEPGWSMTYEVECAVCGRVFDVEQGDYHVMWWKWVPRGVKRKRA